jgi:hypothetical protein
MVGKGSIYTIEFWLVKEGYYESLDDSVLKQYKAYFKKGSRTGKRFSGFARWARENDIPVPTKA